MTKLFFRVLILALVISSVLSGCDIKPSQNENPSLNINQPEELPKASTDGSILPSITSLSPGSVVSSEELVVQGKTQPYYEVIAFNTLEECITHNHHAVGAAKADANGNFSLTVGVSQRVAGDWNLIVVSAEDLSDISGCFSADIKSPVVNFTYSPE